MDLTPLVYCAYELCRDDNVDGLKHFLEKSSKLISNRSHAHNASLTLVESGIRDYIDRKWIYISPLMVACKNGSLAAVQYLVETVGVDIDRRFIHVTGSSIECMTSVSPPLWIAVEAGRYKVVRYLLDQGANVRTLTCSFDPFLFEKACVSGETEIVKALAAYVYAQNAKQGLDNPGRSRRNLLNIGLARSVQNSNENLVRCFLDFGAQVNDNNILPDVPLIEYAAQAGNLDIFSMLVEYGASITGRKGRRAPILLAAISRQLAVVDFLCQQQMIRCYDKIVALEVIGAKFALTSEFEMTISTWQRATQLRFLKSIPKKVKRHAWLQMREFIDIADYVNSDDQKDLILAHSVLVICRYFKFDVPMQLEATMNAAKNVSDIILYTKLYFYYVKLLEELDEACLCHLITQRLSYTPIVACLHQMIDRLEESGSTEIIKADVLPVLELALDAVQRIIQCEKAATKRPSLIFDEFIIKPWFDLLNVLCALELVISTKDMNRLLGIGYRSAKSCAADRFNLPVFHRACTLGFDKAVNGVIRSSKRLVELMVQKFGCDPNAASGHYGLRPIHMAAISKDFETVELLMHNMAHPDSTSADGAWTWKSITTALAGEHKIPETLTRKEFECTSLKCRAARIVSRFDRSYYAKVLDNDLKYFVESHGGQLQTNDKRCSIGEMERLRDEWSGELSD